jgi:transposase
MKNEVDILPIKHHSEKTIAGHFFISFLSTIAQVSIDKSLNKISHSISTVDDSLNRHHCNVHKTRLIVQTPNKLVNDVSKALKIKFPKTIEI